MNTSYTRAAPDGSAPTVSAGRIASLWQRSFTHMGYRVLLHTFFWIFLLFFWLRENLVVHISLPQHYIITVTGITLSLFLFYPLVYGIIPLVQRRRWVAAAIAFAVYYLVAILLRTYHIDRLVATSHGSDGAFSGQDFWPNFISRQLAPAELAKYFFSSLTGLLTIIFIPLTIKFIRNAYRSRIQQAELEKENARLELSFLQAQVNPHMLFNSLNNLQSFIVHDEKERSVALLNRLASLLRFSLYENPGEFAPLHQQVTLLEHFVAVESVRFDERSAISVHIAAETLSYPLPSLLLMPLVENAFKYSAMLPEAAINIRLTNTNDILTFVISNSYAYNDVPHRGGIGLQNVRKRLHHYFPGRHRLDIQHTSDLFTVTLIIYPPAYELPHR